MHKISIMKEKLASVQKYNLWFENTIDCGFPRPLYTHMITRYLGGRLIKVLTGQRRVGKSYILRQIAMQLVQSGVNANNILFINRELTAFDFIESYKDFELFIQTYKSEMKVQGRVYVFIDEVQEIEGWERVVNSLSQDFAEDYEVFITGSNSKMLSGELSTLLSGRYVEFRIFPLSYHEYISVHQMQEGKQSYLQYMNDGGYPELIHIQTSDMKRNYISALKDTILLKDIIHRYTIRDVRLLEDMFAYLVNNSSNLLSISNITNYLKSRGRKTTYDTVAAYLGYLEAVCVAHRVPRYNIRGKEVLTGSSKYYINDLSFKNHLYGGFAFGIGYLLENLVYLDLVRNGYDVYVGTLRDKEVDFVAMKNDRIIYVQVAYILVDDDTVRREYTPLEQIPDSYEKIVVSLDDFQYPSHLGIRHLRAWELNEIL